MSRRNSFLKRPSGVSQYQKRQKLIQDVNRTINSREFKEYLKFHENETFVNAFMRLTFIGLEYLEQNFHCKGQGLQNYLDFLKGRFAELQQDDYDYFIDVEKYYKETYGLEVMAQFNVVVEDKGGLHPEFVRADNGRQK